MKSLRRSLGDKNKDSHGSPGSSTQSPTFPAGFVPSLSKPSSSIAPPKKVIRAKESHSSTRSPQELPFAKGDFFYVVGEREDGRGGIYYEALSEFDPPSRPELSRLTRSPDPQQCLVALEGLAMCLLGRCVLRWAAHTSGELGWVEWDRPATKLKLTSVALRRPRPPIRPGCLTDTISNARGLVPKDKFEEFGRGGTAGGSKSDNGRSERSVSPQTPKLNARLRTHFALCPLV